MTLESLQQNVIRHRVEEATELLNLAADLLHRGNSWTGKMNGLTSALVERARECKTVGETLQQNLKEYMRTHAPDVDITQTVDAEHTQKVLGERQVHIATGRL